MVAFFEKICIIHLEYLDKYQKKIEDLIDEHCKFGAAKNDQLTQNFIEEIKGKRSRFILANDNMVWEYVLENNDIKKKGKR